MTYSQTQHNPSYHNINQTCVNSVSLGPQTHSMRMHYPSFASFPTAYFQNNHASTVSYPQTTYPQILQHNTNRAAAIIDYSNDHRKYVSAPILNNIHTHNFVHNAHQQIDYHQMHSHSHSRSYSNNFPSPNRYKQKIIDNRYDTHKYNQYNKYKSSDNDYKYNKYENDKYRKYEKYNKYDKYNMNESGNCNNMSYYDDHERGRLQRDRDRNSRVVALSTTNVYVNGIPRHWNYAQVEDEFSEYGTILSINLWRDHSTGYSRGSGFVDFKNPYSAQKCIKAMKGMHFDGCKPLIIKYADIRNQKDEVKRRRVPTQHNALQKNGDNRSIRCKSNSRNRQKSRSMSRSRSRSRSRDKANKNINDYYQTKYDKYYKNEENKESQQQIIDYGADLKLDKRDKNMSTAAHKRKLKDTDIAVDGNDEPPLKQTKLMDTDTGTTQKSTNDAKNVQTTFKIEENDNIDKDVNEMKIEKDFANDAYDNAEFENSSDNQNIVDNKTEITVFDKANTNINDYYNKNEQNKENQQQIIDYGPNLKLDKRDNINKDVNEMKIEKDFSNDDN